MEKKLKKVLEAEELSKKPPDDKLQTKEEKAQYQSNLEKAIKIYNELCMGSLGPEDKINVVVSFLKHLPYEGREILIKWRDMLAFVSGDQEDELIELLSLVAKNQGVDSHERSITAVTLYNRALLNVCFKCFENIAIDKSVLIDYRVDACRYLFGSEEQENREVSQEALLEIIEDAALPSEYRYKTIASFISKTGISTFLNTSKLKIPYDELFVFGLQSTFFYSSTSGIRERILSGQHLLQMGCVELDEKVTIGDTLLSFARDQNLEENIRADAADVVLRLGHGLQIDQARNIITEIGHSVVGIKGVGTMNKVKTIYNNSQNMHNQKIGESITKYINKLVKDHTLKIRPYHEIQQEVSAVIKGMDITKEERYSAYSALNRISIDTATFTSHNITISELFVRVWIKIRSYKDETKETLETRMVEELVDMGETCSSGHAGRFVNVLSAVDNELRIGFEDQVIANVAGRVNARVRAIQDSDYKASVSMGMSKDADPQDKENYRKFITDALEELHKELYAEFVNGGYTAEKEFNEYFELARKQWLELLNQ